MLLFLSDILKCRSGVRTVASPRLGTLALWTVIREASMVSALCSLLFCAWQVLFCPSQLTCLTHSTVSKIAKPVLENLDIFIFCLISMNWRRAPMTLPQENPGGHLPFSDDQIRLLVVVLSSDCFWYVNCNTVLYCGSHRYSLPVVGTRSGSLRQCSYKEDPGKVWTPGSRSPQLIPLSHCITVHSY